MSINEKLLTNNNYNNVEDDTDWDNLFKFIDFKTTFGTDKLKLLVSLDNFWFSIDNFFCLPGNVIYYGNKNTSYLPRTINGKLVHYHFKVNKNIQWQDSIRRNNTTFFMKLDYNLHAHYYKFSITIFI